MPRRIILRHGGPDCSDWSVRSGLILGHFFNSLFKLFIGNIFVICLFNELLKLSCGLLSGFNRIHDMHGLPRRIVLRDDWSNRSDRRLSCGHLFCYVCDCVFKLYRRFLSSNSRLV